MIKDARHAHPELTVVRLCDVFSVSRTSFYGHAKGDYTDPDGELAGQIETIIEEFIGYGYRRVTRELARRKKKVNHKRVLRVMRERGLTHRKKPRRTTTTDSGHAHQR
ncbi:transposase [Deinococcus cavernae]|uniref:Transposase n=1 Tax=Deinococcus cavernae TaxID=2320857 RepID=A0A418VHI1_9DEIO|nr:IS3 family transposase [Deinococcus cavernae]RJF75613.1 transposase [Deinococcus cavernae]